METIFATLACYLLLIPLAVVQTQEENLSVTPTIPSPAPNLTHTTATSLPSASSSGHFTVISSSTENPTSFPATTRDNETSTDTTRNNETSTDTTRDNETSTDTTRNNETSTDTTAATPESTSRLQTSEATTNGTSQTNGTSAMTTPGTPTSTALTTTQTTEGYISTPNTTVITTENSSHTGNTTSESIDRTTHGLGLNISEKNMTIVFSVVLGVFGLAVVVFMLHKCRHKIQYLHRPLNNTDDFVADDDTLVISGGLYDGHPIYDNVPTASEDQSQFHLQFLH